MIAAKPSAVAAVAESDLPEGWATTTLGSACAKISDGTHKTPTYQAKGIPFISTANLVPFRAGFDFTEYTRFISRREHDELTKRCCPEKGDILISKCGTIGRSKEVDVDYAFSIFVGVALLKPRKGMFVSRFLEVLLNAPCLQDKFDELSPGSTRRTLTLTAIKTVEVPLPPLAEQRRIVEKVEQLLARVNASRERLARVAAILKRFRQAVLAAACSGRLTADWRGQHAEIEPASQLLRKIEKTRTKRAGKDQTKHRRREGATDEIEQDETVLRELPESWAWCRADQVATVCLGGTPSRKKHSYWNGDVPWVSSGEVANRRVSATEEQITREGLANSNAKVYPKGTVLIAMIGEGKTRGQAAILGIDACTNQNVAGLVFDAGNVSPDYIWSWALSEYERNRAVGRGGAQPALNGEKVRALTLPLPPLEEQQEIVRRLEMLFKLADAIEKRVAVAIGRAEKLTQAILAKAFRGELVPTEAELARREGRPYEPASALLARIRTAQEGRPASGRHAARHRSAPR